MLPKLLLWRRIFREPAEEKMAAKQQRKLRPGSVQSIRGHQRICNKSPQETAKSEIAFQHSLVHHQPNRFADTQNENRFQRSFWQLRRRSFAASSSDRRTADCSKS